MSGSLQSSDIAEQALRESENKYRTLVEQASDGIHTYDFEGNFIETNSKLCEMLGYTAEELLRMNVKDLVPPEDLAVNPIRFDELRAGQTLLNERRLVRKDGTIIPVEISGKMIGNRVLQAIIRDISERKAAETCLKESEERMRAIFEASHDGIVVEENERIVYVNKSYLRLLGYEDPAELIGKDISVVIAPGDLERVSGYGSRRLRGEQPPTKYEFDGRRKDGSFITLEASVSISNVADRAYITTIIRDITERKLIEQALRSSGELLQGTIDALTSNIAVLNDRGVIIKVNASWRAFAEKNDFGLPDYGVGSNYLEKCVPHAETAPSEDDRHALAAAGGIGRVIAGKCDFFELEYSCRIQTEQRWFAMRVTHFGAGAGLHVVVAHEDITDRRRALVEREQAETRLRRSHEELEKRVRERTAELKQTNEALQTEISDRRQAERARIKVLHRLVTAQEDERRRVARDLHDQLGQRLTILRLKLEVLKKLGDRDEDLSRWIDETRDVARQLDHDVDFLAWQMRPTALDDIGLVAALDHYIRQWSAHFDIPAAFYANRSGKTPLAPAAETQLYRIAQEALNNVAKHARASGVNVLLEPRDEHAVLIIEDDGKGFEPDEIAAGGGQTPGGMGIVGMRERAVLVGGSLEIESDAGSGTTVYVKVPVLTEEKGAIK